MVEDSGNILAAGTIIYSAALLLNLATASQIEQVRHLCRRGRNTIKLSSGGSEMGAGNELRVGDDACWLVVEQGQDRRKIKKLSRYRTRWCN